jgi:hypothetical protein
MTNRTPFYLFIDDIRNPDWEECVASGVDPALPWEIARTSAAAIALVKEYGRMPDRIALDHDLGVLFHGKVDEVPVFLRWLAGVFWDGKEQPPEYSIHSSNPAGAANMKSFMDSWRKSVDI